MKSTSRGGHLVSQVNIMMKNVVDVVLGGVSYWAIGYGLSYGEDPVTGEKGQEEEGYGTRRK